MRTNIFKTSVILFSLVSLTACSKPSNQSSNQVEASSATVVEESAASETIHPVSEPMENQKVKSEIIFRKLPRDSQQILSFCEFSLFWRQHLDDYFPRHGLKLVKALK